MFVSITLLNLGISVNYDLKLVLLNKLSLLHDSPIERKVCFLKKKICHLLCLKCASNYQDRLGNHESVKHRVNPS